MPKQKRLPRVEVTWQDIESDATWQTNEDVLAKDPAIITSVGYLLQETDTKLTLAHSKTEGMSDRTTIPIGCVIKTIELRSAGTYKLTKEK